MVRLAELASSTPIGAIGLQPVQRALQLPDVSGHDVGIELGGLHVRMAEPFLEHADVHPVLQYVGGEAVTQGVAAGLLVDPGLLRGPFHRLLKAGFTHMMAHLPGRTRVKGPLPGREYPLPAGLPQGLWVFPGQRLGDVHFSESRLKVLVMEDFHRLDLRLKLVPQVPGQEGGPVLAALAAPDEDETLAEIDI
jgi:hypothetical protein